MNILAIITGITIFGSFIGIGMETKPIDMSDLKIDIKHDHKPLPGDYFETYLESTRINPENGKTWKETYEIDLKQWKLQNNKA